MNQAYVGNDPVNLIDPSGEGPIDPLIRDYFTARALGNALLKVHTGHNDYSDARRHSEWNYAMTKTLSTGRYGAAFFSNAREAQGMFGGHKNSVGERMMDLNNNKASVGWINVSVIHR